MNEYVEIVLKSPRPEEYPDLVVRCRVIKRDKIGEYIKNIPDEDKCVGCKTQPVEARVGVVGETIVTTLMTTYEGREYILSEVKNTVGETEMKDGTKRPDIVVTNIHSTSNEQYIIRADKFEKMYDAKTDGTFTPKPDSRPVAKLSEDVVIETSWGALAVGLKGSYIVTYDEERQSYNTIETFSRECGRKTVNIGDITDYNTINLVETSVLRKSDLDLIKVGSMYMKRIYYPVINTHYIRSYYLGDLGFYELFEKDGLLKCTPKNNIVWSSNKYTFKLKESIIKKNKEKSMFDDLF